MSISTPEQQLEKALARLFSKANINPAMKGYYSDAFVHSAKGLIAAEMNRHINVAKRYEASNELSD
ncbi:hypothetical protein BN80_049 [Yersinia phage phiR1-RT]|uniref:Uncharacterized protein n=1 Tax=Yersinia phage phiR1-RT TaxID=1206558 RepID=I7J3W3_BPPR1|nr:hypothetical protein BN80_049 [Yersinia phage phiR1-RT]CCI88623.1 hypothetical protein BN80_049 [Yersinia phage phiR1-RT]